MIYLLNIIFPELKLLQVFFESSDDPFCPSRKIVLERLSELSDFGLKPISMQSLLYKKRSSVIWNKFSKKNFVRELKKAIELAKELKISNLVFGSPLNRSFNENINTEEAVLLSKSIFLDLADYAKKNDVTICLEFNPPEYGTNFLNNHEELAAFLKFLSHSNLKMTFDIGCMKMSSPSESITESMFANKKFIKHVHISEPNLSIAPKKISELEEITLMLKKFIIKAGSH